MLPIKEIAEDISVLLHEFIVPNYPYNFRLIRRNSLFVLWRHKTLFILDICGRSNDMRNFLTPQGGMRCVC